MNGPTTSERPVAAVRGTRDRLPDEYARLGALEMLLLDRFGRAGYEPLRTPVLEPIELHERKSGAGIVSKLFELAGVGEGVCLRPELTAGVVRAYTDAEIPPTLPWRVSHAGTVFRYEPPRPDRLREFRQVGVERIGDAGPIADAEVIWLADWALAEAGVTGATIRLGHVGLILEMLDRSGLPAPSGAALIERLSEAAAEGRGVGALETGLEQLAGWLRAVGAGEVDEIAAEVDQADDVGIDRLFRTLVPVVTGRRSGHEIVHRLRRKWELGHGLLGALARVRDHVHRLAALTGDPNAVLAALGSEVEALAPESVAALRALVAALEEHGIDASRVVLDLGFGRGIGFYSQMVFEITAMTPDGPVEVCGGGRYDGLARVLGSPRDDRGVGFAFGLERLASVLDAQDRAPSPLPPRGFLVLASDADASVAAARLAVRLRAAGARALLETNRGLDEALALAEESGIPRVIVVDVENRLLLHDLVSMNEAATTPDALDRLARAEARP